MLRTWKIVEKIGNKNCKKKLALDILMSYINCQIQQEEQTIHSILHLKFSQGYYQWKDLCQNRLFLLKSITNYDKII